MAKLLPLFLLVLSNIFMTYAWYGHLKDMATKPIVLVVLACWLIAFFEYCLMVPANRLGYQHFSLAQLKIAQEVITLSVFAVFAVWYMREPLTLDFLWAGLCLLGAAFFMFRHFGAAAAAAPGAGA